MDVSSLRVIKGMAGQPAATGASTAARIRGRGRELLGRVLNRAGVPGAIQALDERDELTGTHLQIEVSPLFTKIQVNGRDFYFDRVTGRFDGTGQGCV